MTDAQFTQLLAALQSIAANLTTLNATLTDGFANLEDVLTPCDDGDDDTDDTGL